MFRFQGLIEFSRLLQARDQPLATRHDGTFDQVAMPGLIQDVATRAVQVHGALGVSNELPLGRMLLAAPIMGLADGPTEVHKVTIARQVLRNYKATDGMWPSEWIPGKIDAAKAAYADLLELEVGNL